MEEVHSTRVIGIEKKNDKVSLTVSGFSMNR